MDLTTLERLPLWIGGRAVAAHTTRYAEVTNPATGEVLRHVPLGDAADVDAAVAAATAALPAWRAAPALRRARVLMRFRDLMEAHKTDLARLVSQEHGKTVSDAEGSITRGIEVVEFATGIPHLLKGDFSDNVGTDVDSFSLRQPVGVCAGITPFNFPAMVPMWMFPVALACGNTFILKPSERDPTMSLRMAELLTEAGLARRRVQRRARRQGGGRRHPRASCRSRRFRSSARRRLRATFTRPDRAMASAFRRWAAPRTMRW